MQTQKIATGAVMIKPMSFTSNPETIASNSFQKSSHNEKNETILKKSQQEFLQFQKKLCDHGLKILKFEELLDKKTPDALFPNNWFCQLPDGRVFVFPMFPKNRRDEYRADVIRSLNAKDIIDLRYLERENYFLEGTGSLILDHDKKIGFACLSSRTSQNAVDLFSQLSGYKIATFNSTSFDGSAIYHTNVMMALSPKYAVLCLESIKDPQQKKGIVQLIEKTGRAIVDISYAEMNNFAGNMLFLSNGSENFWICSTKAFSTLSLKNKKILESEATFIHADLNTIETYGGGGARCLLAETFD
jgi:hypothetical protein